jgi:hypothetical protein
MIVRFRKRGSVEHGRDALTVDDDRPTASDLIAIEDVHITEDEPGHATS